MIPGLFWYGVAAGVGLRVVLWPVLVALWDEFWDRKGLGRLNVRSRERRQFWAKQGHL